MEKMKLLVPGEKSHGLLGVLVNENHRASKNNGVVPTILDKKKGATSIVARIEDQCCGVPRGVVLFYPLLGTFFSGGSVSLARE